MENKKFKVISLHPFTECNMEPKCPFCYKSCSNKKDEKPEKFWTDLIPYVGKLTDQIAMGGGEPFMNPAFVKKMGAGCKANNVLFNITSNGRLLMKMSDKELKSVLKNVTMISLSFDNHKIQSDDDLKEYLKLVKRINASTGCQIGTNLLISKDLMEKGGRPLLERVDLLFRSGVKRVFALFPKNVADAPDILKFKAIYLLLTMKYKHFYVDDTSKMIMQEGSYHNWKNACHYGKDLISINELGYITGCSFDPNDKALLKIDKPKDLLKLKKIKLIERFDCPYIMKK